MAQAEQLRKNQAQLGILAALGAEVLFGSGMLPCQDQAHVRITTKVCGFGEFRRRSGKR